MATITTPAVTGGEVVQASWGNSVRADLLALNTAKAELSGATFTGAVTLPNANPSANNHATRKLYVDGLIASRAPLAGADFTGAVQVGGDGSSAAGVRTNISGSIRSYAGDSLAGAASLALTRIGTSGAAPAEPYIYFLRGIGGTLIGSVLINAGGNGVNFNTTSDRRTKDDLGPLNPDSLLRRILALTPRRLRGKETGIEFDGFIADEVQATIPAAVTGEPDAVNDDGTPRYQQLALSEIIPPLVGAVKELHNRLARLEGAKS